MDDLARSASVVGERSMGGEVQPKGWVERMEVRMPAWVAHNSDENSERRMPKVSVARFVLDGLVGT